MTPNYEEGIKSQFKNLLSRSTLYTEGSEIEHETRAGKNLHIATRLTNTYPFREPDGTRGTDGDELAHRNRLILYWVPGHSGIIVNKKADECARH